MSGNICRFYLNNNCRFGDRCRYSHNVSNSSIMSSPSKNPYVYVKDQHGANANSKKPLDNADVQQLVLRIQEEAKQIEYDKMWPFSCLGVLKDVPSVPGWDDYSMEELRMAAYTSKAAGRFDEFVAFCKGLKQKAKENRFIFLRPGKKAEEIVREMFEKRSAVESQNSAFEGSSVSSTPSIPFSSSKFPNSSPLHSSNAPFGTGDPFSSQDTSPGIFAMAARGFSQTGVSHHFQSSEMLNDTAMETAFIDAGVSHSQSSAESAFNKNIFGNVPQQNSFAPSTTPAGIAASPPSNAGNSSGQSASLPSVVTQLNSIFTPISELTPLELEQFKATTFTLEDLPLRPPPRELC